MQEESVCVIYTADLFAAINGYRREQQLEAIEVPLIASKLGILFSLKIDHYISFKGEYVELNAEEMSALLSILNEHFNVEMQSHLRSFCVPQRQHQYNAAADVQRLLDTPQPYPSLLTRLKGFLKRQIQGAQRPRIAISEKEQSA